MRLTRALIAPVLLLLFVVACSSPAVSDGGDGNGNGDGSEQSQAAEETSGDGGDDGGGGGGGDNGGGGSAGDADAAFERLTPPNADQVTKTTAEGVIFAAFTSPDSVDDLTSFYMDAFDDLGLDVLTTTEAADGISWIVGTDDTASEFGGVVSLVPTQDGSGGTTVSIQIGSTN
jgi:hypothetical protein